MGIYWASSVSRVILYPGLHCQGWKSASQGLMGSHSIHRSGQLVFLPETGGLSWSWVWIQAKDGSRPENPRQGSDHTALYVQTQENQIIWGLEVMWTKEWGKPWRI